MYNVSERYLAAISNRVRSDTVSGEIILANGSTIEISGENLVKNTLKLSRELCSGKYRIGTFNLSCLRFGIFIDNALGLDLTDARVYMSYVIGIGEDETESVPLGIFAVDPVLSARRKDILNIVAYDLGVLFDREPSDTLRNRQCTPAELVCAVCAECGVQTDIDAHSLDDMPNSSVAVCAKDSQMQTCRDIIMWCAALLCGYAVMDRDGKLKIISAKYSVSPEDSSVILTDRLITQRERSSIYVTDTRAYIKHLTAYKGSDVVNYTSVYVSEDEQASPASYVLEKNPLLSGCTDNVYDNVNRAWLSYIDAFKQRGVKARIMGDPAVDVGDTIAFSGGDVDQRQGIVGVVTSYEWNFRNYQDIVCCAAECCGSLLSSAASQHRSAGARSQSSKRMDSIEAEIRSTSSGGVGENINRHNERFNAYADDYFVNTFSDNNYGDYNTMSGLQNTIGAGNVFAYDVGGQSNTVSGGASRGLVRGNQNTVTGGLGSITAGEGNNVSGGYGLTVGMSCTVTGNRSLTYGLNCSNTRNGALAGGEYAATGSTYLVAIGYGGFADSPKNVFTVDLSGDVTAHSYNTSAADYAEYFEWCDGNPEAQDRMGLLVDQIGDKIAPAQGCEFFGAISARASVIGNAYEDYWHSKYLTDVFGRLQYDDEGHALISPDFDPTREYVPRSKRPEWAVTGIAGRIIIVDDGSCKPGGYVSARHGIGTSCYAVTPARVLRRVDDTHVEILLK